MQSPLFKMESYLHLNRLELRLSDVNGTGITSDNENSDNTKVKDKGIILPIFQFCTETGIQVKVIYLFLL